MSGPDQRRGKICPASLLHDWHGVMFDSTSLLESWNSKFQCLKISLLQFCSRNAFHNLLFSQDRGIDVCKWSNYLKFKTLSKGGWDVIGRSSWWELFVILFLCLGMSSAGIMHSRRYHGCPFKSSVWIWVTSEWILLRAVLGRTSSMESNFTLKEGSPPDTAGVQCNVLAPIPV